MVDGLFVARGVNKTALTAVNLATIVVSLFGIPIVNAYIRYSLPELRTYAVMVLRVFSSSFFFAGINIVTAGFLISMEKSAPAMVISSGRVFSLLAGRSILAATLGGNSIWFTPLAAEESAFFFHLCFYDDAKRKYPIAMD